MRSGFDVSIASQVRPLRSSDCRHLEEIVRAEPNFTAEEVETALELIDASLSGDDEYIVNILENRSGEIIGFECHGPTPLTEGTFDLYWIVVDPRAQRRGFGGRLLRGAEEDITRRGGRLLVVETSSKPSYAPTVEFYKRNGYRVESRIRNFYRPGDDKLTLVKELAQES